MLMNQGIDESLFTELTADQAEMLEGGKRIDILQVRCIQAGGGSDSLFFKILGGEEFRKGDPINMVQGSVANVGIGVNFNTSRVGVFLMDKNSGKQVGFFSASRPGQNRVETVTGDGSKYEVTFNLN